MAETLFYQDDFEEEEEKYIDEKNNSSSNNYGDIDEHIASVSDLSEIELEKSQDKQPAVANAAVDKGAEIEEIHGDTSPENGTEIEEKRGDTITDDGTEVEETHDDTAAAKVESEEDIQDMSIAEPEDNHHEQSDDDEEEEQEESGDESWRPRVLSFSKLVVDDDIARDAPKPSEPEYSRTVNRGEDNGTSARELGQEAETAVMPHVGSLKETVSALVKHNGSHSDVRSDVLETIQLPLTNQDQPPIIPTVTANPTPAHRNVVDITLRSAERVSTPPNLVPLDTEEQPSPSSRPPPQSQPQLAPQGLARYTSDFEITEDAVDSDEPDLESSIESFRRPSLERDYGPTSTRRFGEPAVLQPRETTQVSDLRAPITKAAMPVPLTVLNTVKLNNALLPVDIGEAEAMYRLKQAKRQEKKLKREQFIARQIEIIQRHTAQFVLYTKCFPPISFLDLIVCLILDIWGCLGY